jgi:hypothetical protein
MAVWRDISLLWLILLTLIAVLPFGFLFFFAVKGLHRLRQLVKQHLPPAQEKARQMADIAEQMSQKVANPIIGAQAKAAQVGGISKAILSRRKES